MLATCSPSLLAAASILVVACAANAPRPDPAAGGDAPVEIVARDLDQREVRLSQLRGRVVLLDIFASWCEPCRDSLPFYAELSGKNASRDLSVVLVSVDEDESALRRFLSAMRITATVWHDPSGRAAEVLGLRVMPTMVVFDREGRVCFRHESFKPSDRPKIAAAVASALDAAPASSVP